MSHRVECNRAHACTRTHIHARTRIRQINIKRSSDSFSMIFWIIILPHGVLCTTSLVTTIPIQFSSVAQSCPTLCDPMNRSRPGLPVHHQLPEFTQTHVHRVGDAIQPSHPLSSPSPPAPHPSQLKQPPLGRL